MSATEQYYSGAQGRVLAGGVAPLTPTNDWNVTEWEATTTAKAAVTTTTKLWDSVTKRLWTRRQATSWEVTGTFSFFYDKTNPPYAYIAPGKVVGVELFINDVDNITGPVFIDDIQHKSGGMDGIQMCTVKFTSNGAMTLPGDAP